MTTPVAPRTPGFPERVPASQGNPHLNEWMTKVEQWMSRMHTLAEALISGVNDGTVATTLKSSFNFVTAPSVVAFEPTQDSVDPRKFTIPGADTWTAGSIRVYLNGQRLRTSLLTISGVGNRTITLDASVPAPGAGDVVEGEGIKADI